MPGIAQYTSDGDAGFTRVDTRRPAHELEPGVAADAVNKRFEDGRAWPRHGVACQAWGSPVGGNMAAGGNFTDMVGPLGLHYFGFDVPNTYAGETYIYTAGAHESICFLFPPGTSTTDGSLGTPIASGAKFVFPGGLLQLRSGSATTVTGSVTRVLRPRAFGRFNDPTGTDNLVLVTDDWRDSAGEDGGRGRAYRIVAGQTPQAMPLNGHDVWDEGRLVPCYNGLALVRQGNERHYFQGAAVDAATSRVQLNCAPAWASGDQVQIWGDANSVIQGTNANINLAGLYFVKNIAGNKVELYVDSALTTKLDMSGGATGRFYLERQALLPGFFGNGAPTLLMQPDGSGLTAFQNGFLAAALNVPATAFDGTAKVLSAPNHRLIPGDKVQYTHTSTAVETFYVAVLSGDKVMLYASEVLALAGGLANAQTPAPAWASGDFIAKDGASGLPMPPAREGVYLPCGRLLLVNGQNNLAISDPLDPLHFTPFQALINANLGESDKVTSVIPLGTDPVGKDVTIVAKENVILAVLGLSGAANTWQLKEVTREYGFLAPLATVVYGADVWGLGRKGVVSVAQGVAGTTTGVALPMSFDLKKYIDLVDWTHAKQAAGATWNNRVFFAVPLKGQAPGGAATVNNAVLVFNGLNQGWEGMWQGAALQVYGFALHKVFGDERLCFVNYSGQVCYLSDDFQDTLPGAAPVAIADSLTTRIYCQGSQAPKLWLRGRVVWDTNNPKLTVTAQAPGYNEQWPLITDLQYDPTQYQANGQAPYDPASGANFDAPNRQDYALTAEELTAGAVDVHQNTSEKVRMRINDWGVQLVISNAQGSARVGGVVVEFVPGLRTASKQT